MNEYEQQINELINSGILSNWRLALEIYKGLNIEDAELIIGTKCHGLNSKMLPDGWDDFIYEECNCDWGIKFTDDNFNIITHIKTGKELVSKHVALWAK